MKFLFYQIFYLLSYVQGSRDCTHPYTKEYMNQSEKTIIFIMVEMGLKKHSSITANSRNLDYLYVVLNVLL